MIDAQTSVVALIERYPQLAGLLASYGIHVDEHTPWWQTLHSATALAGNPPQRFHELINVLRQAVAV